MEHEHISIYCSKCGYAHKVVLYCGDRLCEECKKRNYPRLLSRYQKPISSISQGHLSQITLTYHNFSYLTSSQVKSIQKDFKTLTHTQFWKDRIRGGLAVIECKHESDSAGWNLHLHILVDASFIPQSHLSSIWKKITGHSYIVDVRQEHNAKSSFSHLIKYFLKSPIIRGSNEQGLKDSYNQSFFRCRNIIAFGTLYNSIDEGVDSYRYQCPKCGNKGWISEYEIERMSRAEVGSFSPYG
jgi:hypothetical protein